MLHHLARASLIFALAGCAAQAPISAPPSAPPYTPDAALSGAAHVAFTLPRGADPAPFFDLPWPSELARRADGRPDFRAFPGGDAPIFDAYLDVAARDVEGFSVAPAIYFRFSPPLASLRLPADHRAAASASASVFLVDVDPQSPERGTFFPIEHRYHAAATRFIPAGTLAVKPVAGFVLRPSTLYAAVVRREIGGADLGTTMDLEALKWTSPRPDAREEAARRAHAGAFDDLARLGAPRDRIAAIALFRTQAPHAITARMLDVATRLPPDRAPRVIEARWADHHSLRSDRGSYLGVEGVYCTPNFQGDLDRAPYLAAEGGRVTFDAAGAPRIIDAPRAGRYASGVCDGLLRARFVLTIPTTPMPPGGYPLLVSAHGTGGDAATFLGEDDFAGWAASQGIAVVSTDQPIHGGRGPAPRPGSREPIAISIAGIPITLSSSSHVSEVAFYNPLHPDAARDNLRQAAIDLMMLARIFSATDFTTARDPHGAPLLAAIPDRAPPRFDRARIMAAGHSQGSQSAAVAGAIDPLLRGVILSGCGGDARLGILRRNDLPIVPLLAALIGLAPGELDEMHPLMTLVQTLADPIDPASYARFYWDPPIGRRAPSVLHFEGMTDTYTPPVTAEALAIALRAAPITPVEKPLSWLDARAQAIGDHLASPGPHRLFAQFRSTRNENGHFVIYHEPEAMEMVRAFLRATITDRR